MLFSACMFIVVGAFLCWALTAKSKAIPGKPGATDSEYGSSWNLVADSVGGELEFAAIEEDAGTVVGEDAEAVPQFPQSGRE